MADKLLVRVYDVGFGDCIYVRVPDGDDAFHVLIDCGSIAVDKSKDLQTGLEKALAHVRDSLPDIPDRPGKKRLDLLVVTHPHMDHINGLDPKRFRDIRIGQIWMSAFFMDGHPQTKQAHSLQALADRQATAFLAKSARRGIGLDARLQDLFVYRLLDEDALTAAGAVQFGSMAGLIANSICNKNALAALKKTGGDPQRWLDPDAPRAYVSRDHLAIDPADALPPGGLTLEVDEGVLCLTGFREKNTVLRVLAPEWDIDGNYLGQSSDKQGVYGALAAEPQMTATPEDAWPSAQKLLRNISETDFRRLQSRLMSSMFAFSQEDDSLKNDTSLVLLLEWRGQRLLFPGDAEWRGREFTQGKRNSCWEVMWNNGKVQTLLGAGLHFWKVGHHGSINGTPYYSKRNDQPLLKGLTSADKKAEIVVSTWSGKFTSENPVPNFDIMKALGDRAATSRAYDSVVAQPLRTDLEEDVPGESVRFVQVELPA
jgi:beta-lactamase superfamily II metal-dependent hydrolase